MVLNYLKSNVKSTLFFCYNGIYFALKKNYICCSEKKKKKLLVFWCDQFTPVCGCSE